MGLLGSMKKKQPKEEQQWQHTAGVSGTMKPPLSNKRKTGNTQNKWSPLRLSSSFSNATNTKPSPAEVAAVPHDRRQQSGNSVYSGASQRSKSSSYQSSSILQQLNVVASGDIEVMTPETKQALMEQREAIRRKLFGSATDVPQPQIIRANTLPSRNASASTPLSVAHPQSRNDMWRSPSTPGDRRSSGRTPLTADKASMPLSAVSLSWSNDSDGGGRDERSDSKQPTNAIENEMETSIEATMDRVVVTSGTKEIANVEIPPTTTPLSVVHPQQQPVWISPEHEEQRTHEKRNWISGAMYRDRSALKPPAGVPKGSHDEEYEGNGAGETNNMNISREQTVFSYDSQQDTTTPLVSNKKVDSSGWDQAAIIVPLDSPAGTPLRILTKLESLSSGSKQLPPTCPDFCGESRNNPAVESGSTLHNHRSDTTKTTTSSNRNTDSPATLSMGMTGSSSLTPLTDGASTFRGRQLLVEASGVARDIVAAAIQCTPTRIRDSVFRESGGGTFGEDASVGLAGVCDPSLAPSKDPFAASSSFELSVASRKPSKLGRPLYLDEETAVRFLRRIMHNGFILLYLQPPRDECDGDSKRDDWQGRTITMTINKGEIEDTENGTVFRAPQLEWMTVAGGQAVEATTTTVNLMDILDISTELEDLLLDGEGDHEALAPGDDDMCFFTVTTGDGDVHMFEAAHTEERDRIVSGLKTIIARLSFNLIVGDTTAVADFFQSSNTFLAESSLPTDERLEKQRSMDRLAHTLFDDEGFAV